MKAELSNVTGYLDAFLQFLVVKDGKLTDYHKKNSFSRNRPTPD